MINPDPERNSLGSFHMPGEIPSQLTGSSGGLDRNPGMRTQPRGGGAPMEESYEKPVAQAIELEAPRSDDGREMWRIARDTHVLDVNSPYSYVLWCRDFADSSVVARDAAGGVCGFITGFIRPQAAATLFVWQVAVDQAHRGQGLAKRMLDYLGDRIVAEGRRYLEATVTPDNVPSSRLFESFARDRGSRLERSTLFTPEHFPGGHQPEVLYRIGPL
jgi:L-2,4-diaminobutyric acid acetyltransferase